MLYLEYLRARRLFVWFAAILAVIGAFTIGSAVLGSGANFDFSDSGPGGSKAVYVHGLASLGTVDVPLAGFAGLAGVVAIVFGTCLAASLNRNTQHAHFLLVRPLARERMAAQTIAVDVAAIAITGLVAFVVAGVTALGVLRDHATFIGAQALPVLVLGIGAAVMWYGVLQALSAWTSRRGGAFVGIGAAVLAFAIPLSQATWLGPLHELFKAILFIDPLAYFTSVTFAHSGDVTVGAQIFASIGVRAALVWILAAAALTVATFCWKRVEV